MGGFGAVFPPPPPWYSLLKRVPSGLVLACSPFFFLGQSAIRCPTSKHQKYRGFRIRIDKYETLPTANHHTKYKSHIVAKQIVLFTTLQSFLGIPKRRVNRVFYALFTYYVPVYYVSIHYVSIWEHVSPPTGTHVLQGSIRCNGEEYFCVQFRPSKSLTVAHDDESPHCWPQCGKHTTYKGPTASH